MGPRQGNNPFGVNANWRNPYHQKRSEREPALPPEIREGPTRAADNRHRRRTWPAPTECPVLWASSKERCGREKAAEAPVCDVCVKVIVRGEQGKTWFQLWLMEFVGETARRTALADARARRAQSEKQRREAVTGIEVVYYIRTGDNMVKVGTTADFRQRMKQLYTKWPSVVAIEPGGRTLEKQRHRELRKWRIDQDPRTEVFAEGPEVTERINAVLAEHGEPQAWLDAAEAARAEAETQEAS